MKHFAPTAAAFEGSLALLAMALGWLLGVPPLETFHVEPHPAALGAMAALPPLALFWLCLKCPLPPFRRIARVVDELIVPLFRDFRPTQLLVVAGLAGLGEEMLFRGVIQPAAAHAIGGAAGAWIGLLLAAALFGLLHPITPTYALLAAVIGGYLGWLQLKFGNLLVPVAAHGVYDFIALAYMVNVRARSGGESQ